MDLGNLAGTGGGMVLAYSLIEVIKTMVKRRNGNGNGTRAGTSARLLEQQRITAESVTRMAESVQELYTKTAIIEKTTERIEGKVDALTA